MNILSLLALFLSAFVVFMLNGQKISELEENKRLIKPSKDIRYFHLGYNDMIADSLWLRLIQDLGICEQNRLPEGAKRFGTDRITDCEFGWGFHMLDVITDLAPKFRMAYYAGSTSLTVLADDIKGASVIFDKGLKYIPNDRQFVHNAAAHFLIEVGDKEKAAKLFNRSADLGSPEWTRTLAARLYTEAGKALLARQMLTNFVKNNPKARFTEHAKERLKEINKILAREGKKNP